jgi:hypothetical protein
MRSSLFLLPLAALAGLCLVTQGTPSAKAQGVGMFGLPPSGQGAPPQAQQPPRRPPPPAAQQAPRPQPGPSMFGAGGGGGPPRPQYAPQFAPQYAPRPQPNYGYDEPRWRQPPPPPPRAYYSDDDDEGCYWTRRRVRTPYGLRWRRVRICD